MARAKTIHMIEYRNLGASIDVPLKLVTDRVGRERAPDFTYSIDIDEPIRFGVRGKDPEELTKKLYAALDAALQISWKPHLYVRVKTNGAINNNYNGSLTTGRELSIHVDYVLIGSKPDGTFVHDFYDGADAVWQGTVYKPRFGAYAQGKPDTCVFKKCREMREDSEKESRSLIDDTEQNRTALAAICAAMESLSSKLAAVLEPGVIQHTLNAVPPKMGLTFTPPTTSET